MDANQDQAPTLKELYPNLTPDELVEAEKNLDQYLRIVLEIFDDIESDPARLVLLKQEIRGRKELRKFDSP